MLAAPVVRELNPVPSVLTALHALADQSRLLLFDSAAVRQERGRYSFLMAEPIEFVEIETAAFGTDPFASLRAWSSHWQAAEIPELPPFQGGIAGLMSYELGGCWEKIPSARHSQMSVPVLSAGLYPWVMAWDHVASRCWIMAHGWPEEDSHQAQPLAESRIKSIQQRLTSDNQPRKPTCVPATPCVITPPPAWARQITENIWSDFDQLEYLAAVQRVIEYIRAGDIFQANLTQRLWVPTADDPLTIYERLRNCNPAPFAGYFQGNGWTIISASPERYLHVNQHMVSTRPIKGTRRRSTQPEADLYTRDILRESEKDQAENVMIVDLLRNDLSRVCRPGSVHVPQLCQVETFATVQHLVSEVQGTLSEKHDVWDLFAQAFPGGSITGAPKIRAMEIIAELEPTVRGPYTGSLFYVGPGNRVDSNLLIRTFLYRDGWLQCGVGGGIVAQSSPESEYQETWHKAAGMLQALGLRAP